MLKNSEEKKLKNNNMFQEYLNNRVIDQPVCQTLPKA
jgi:hypothetical protein